MHLNWYIKGGPFESLILKMQQRKTENGLEFCEIIKVKNFPDHTLLH